ncbi:MAG: S-layer homology domain-containing protein [Oscillospiraceae bacterium]|nr:S-layer homology domain-containing protein [Oscillospiraceae bacterium]
MKKKIVSAMFLMLLVICSVHALAAESFDDGEYSRAVSVSEGVWQEFTFSDDLLFKVDVSDKGTTTVFEVNANGYDGYLQYYVFTKGDYTFLTQNNVGSIPGYISVPHVDNFYSSYIKLEYANPTNAALINKPLKVRLRTVKTDISGWESAAKIGLNEDHTVTFSSMSDNKWYKLIVPDEQFKYTFTMRSPSSGCFIAELYSEEDLLAGGSRSSFSDCISLDVSRSTITAQMGKGTYYIHLYPVPFYDGVLGSKIVFATDNKNSNEVITTSFGAQVSTWAAPEIEAAFRDNLIPEIMVNFDLTKKVTRGEFAAIAVQLYENMAKRTVEEAINCTFVDITHDDNAVAIRKAYQIDVAQGTSATTYAPLDNINREQLATMLCRVIKKYSHPSWTMATDDDFIMQTHIERLFDDDDQISDWAKPSVYFMAGYGIIQGVDATHFAPKNETTQQEASGYASATREQAIILAHRIFNQAYQFD